MPQTPERKRAYMKEYRAKAENKKRQALYMRAWFLDNRKHCLDYQRQYRADNHEKILKQHNDYAKEYHKRPHVKWKIRAQQKAQHAIKMGRLIRQPCESCGSCKVQAHHDDYSKPLQVRWLCDPCHKRAHAVE